MKTVTLRIDEPLDRWLSTEAKRLGRTKSAVMRAALQQQRNGKKPRSVHDQMQDVCGTIKGTPADVSSNLRKHLKGLGQ